MYPVASNGRSEYARSRQEGAEEGGSAEGQEIGDETRFSSE